MNKDMDVDITSEDNSKNEYMIKFGQRLKTLRKKKKVRITTIIATLDIHRSTYASWEAGRRFPSIILLGRLADVLETNIDYLLLKTDQEEPLQEHLDLKKLFLSSESPTWDGKPIPEDKQNLFYSLLSSMMSEEKTSDIIKKNKSSD